jgi:hypothetical protein
MVRSLSSSVNTVSDYRLDNRSIWVWYPVQAKDFPLTSVSRPALGSTQPPIYWVPGFLSGNKPRPWCDADHSPPSSAEVKNEYELYLLSSLAAAWHSGTTLLFNNMWWRLQIMELLITVKHFSILPSFPPPYVQIFSSKPCSQTPWTCRLPLTWETKFFTHTNYGQNCCYVYLNLYVFRQQTARQKILICYNKYCPNLIWP